MRRAVLVVSALTLCACVPQSRTTVTSTRTPTAIAAARTGGILRVAITPPDGIDPTGAHEPAGELITRTMCDQLLTFDPVTGDPQPSIASSWTISDGGRSLFVRLRDDAEFSNGTPVTAEDVVFTLSRLANALFASPSAAILEPIGGYGFVHGELDTDDEHLRQSLSGVSLVDSQTVAIGLAEPHGDVFRALAHPATSPVPQALVEADPAAFANRPVCSGPYALGTVPEPGAPIALDRVEGYTGANGTLSSGGAGYADKITFSIHPTRKAAADAVRAGDADLAPLSDGDQRRPARGMRVETVSTLQVEYVGMPTTTPPFDDASLRRALSLAIDRDALTRVWRGKRVPASGVVPRMLAGELPESCAVNTSFSLEEARVAMRASGVDPSTLVVRVVFNDEFGNAARVAELARQWRRLGLRVRPVPMSWPAYEAAARRPQGIGAVFRFGWEPSYPSAERFMAPLFTEGGIGRENWSLYSSRDVNDALRELREAEDPRDAANEVRRAHAILCDDLPLIPLLNVQRGFLVRNTVRSAVGVFGDATSGQPLLRELFLR